MLSRFFNSAVRGAIMEEKFGIKRRYHDAIPIMRRTSLEFFGVGIFKIALTFSGLQEDL